MLSRIVISSKIIFIISFLMGVIFLNPVAAIQNQSDVNLLITQYFDFLFTGNLTSIKTISTGRLYTEIERLEKNSEYSKFLRKHYEKAEYKIVDYKLISRNNLRVDVAVKMSDGVMNKFFIYIDEKKYNNSSDLQMKIENTERQ